MLSGSLKEVILCGEGTYLIAKSPDAESLLFGNESVSGYPLIGTYQASKAQKATVPVDWNAELPKGKTVIEKNPSLTLITTAHFLLSTKEKECARNKDRYFSMLWNETLIILWGGLNLRMFSKMKNTGQFVA